MLNDSNSISLGNLLRFVESLNNLFGSDVRIEITMRIGSADHPEVVDVLEQSLRAAGLPYQIIEEYRDAKESPKEQPAAHLPAVVLESQPKRRGPGRKPKGGDGDTEASLTTQAQSEPVTNLGADNGAAPSAPDTTDDSQPEEAIKPFAVGTERLTQHELSEALRIRLKPGTRVRNVHNNEIYKVTAKRTLVKVRYA